MCFLGAMLNALNHAIKHFAGRSLYSFCSHVDKPSKVPEEFARQSMPMMPSSKQVNDKAVAIAEIKHSEHVRTLSRPNLAWKTIVNVIPLATEDFLVTYAIIGIQGSTLDANARDLGQSQLLSLVMTGAKALLCALGALWFLCRHRKGGKQAVSSATLLFISLEFLSCAALGAVAIYLSAMKQAPEPSFQYLFLTGSICGKICWLVWLIAF
jgi:hypothetical protein